MMLNPGHKRSRAASPPGEAMVVYAANAPPIAPATVDEGVSFRDTVMRSWGGTQTVRGNVSTINLDEDDITVTRGTWGPSLSISVKLREQLYKQWSSALIVKLVGANHSISYFAQKLQQKWNMLREQWQLIDIANGYYIVCFSHQDDLNHILYESPWMITGRYLAIQRWKPGFNSTEDTIKKLTGWVRITGLHLEWFEHCVLKRIGDALGTMQRMDDHTTNVNRGQYARLCVEIDLTRPLEASIEVDGVWYQIQYEGLDNVCLHCGIFGHVKASYSQRKVPGTNVETDAARPVVANDACETDDVPTDIDLIPPKINEWNIVQPRRPRRPPQAATHDSQRPHVPAGSRFRILQNEVSLPGAHETVPSSGLPSTFDAVLHNGREKGKQILQNEASLPVSREEVLSSCLPETSAAALHANSEKGTKASGSKPSPSPRKPVGGRRASSSAKVLTIQDNSVCAQGNVVAEVQVAASQGEEVLRQTKIHSSASGTVVSAFNLPVHPAQFSFNVASVGSSLLNTLQQAGLREVAESTISAMDEDQSENYVIGMGPSKPPDDTAMVEDPGPSMWNTRNPGLTGI